MNERKVILVDYEYLFLLLRGAKQAFYDISLYDAGDAGEWAKTAIKSVAVKE